MALSHPTKQDSERLDKTTSLTTLILGDAIRFLHPSARRNLKQDQGLESGWR